MWPEVKTALDEKRYELILSGDAVNKRIEDEGQLDNALFDLVNVNFLRISGSPLVSISEDIAKMVNLGNLILQGNKLESLPDAIGSLQKLKLLDISMNHLTTLPQSISNLTNLTSLNACSNKLQILPNLETLPNLAILDLRENELTEFPQVCSDTLGHLAEIRLGTNKLGSVPCDVAKLPVLKLLDVASNEIKIVPGELIDCVKLKELNLKGNPLNDRRLKKLVESDRCVPRQVLDYVKQNCPRVATADGKAGGKGKKGKGKGKNKDRDEVGELCDEIEVLSVNDDIPVVQVDISVKDMRPYIVCCILHNVDLNGDNMKKFISAQTKLHEGICEKRMVATIATHDLAKMKSPLKYLARAPDEIKIHPLVRGKEVSGRELYDGLQQEAEAQRKQQKRNNVSGIHKFLHLVDRWSMWPCLVDAGGTVVSLPPITNSDNTKITATTTDVFMEVTSGESLGKAKEVMDALVLSSLSCGLSPNDTPTEEGAKRQKKMKVGQVRVEDIEGGLKVLYPSRVDLGNAKEGIRVILPGK